MSTQPEMSAETALISCLMMDGTDAVGICQANGIKPEMFTEPRARIIWDAITSLVEAGVAIGTSGDGMAPVAEHLKSQGRFDAVGGYAALIEFSQHTPGLGHTDFFCKRIAETHGIRRATKLLQIAQENIGKARNREEMLEALLPSLAELDGLAITDKSETLLEVIDRVEEDFDSAVKGEPPVGDNLYTGIPELDSKLTPLNARRDKYVTIAARPSKGKTSLATQLMQHTLANVKDSVVLDFQLENSRDNHIAQMASRAAQINLEKRGEWTTDEAEKFKRYLAGLRRIQEQRLFIYEHDKSIESLCRRARWVKAKTGKLTLMVVDYIQLMTCDTERYRSPRELMNHVSGCLKSLGKELGCVSVILSQLSREHEKEERAPELRDLLESGQIESDSERVWMLGIPKGVEYDPATGFIETTLYQRKNKYGKVGKADLMFKRTTTTFFGKKAA